MFQLLAKLVSTVVACSLLLGVATASAPIPYKERSSGTITSFVPGHLEFSGAGKATLLGKYDVSGRNDFDGLGNVFNGELVQTTADESTLTATYAGTFTPLASGEIRFNITLTWISGTGRFAGVTGTANVVAIAEGPFPGAAFQAEGLGSLVLP